MAVTGIPTTDDGTDHLERIRDVDLPRVVENLAAGYDRHFVERDRFLWKWIHALFPEFTLSCVDDDAAAHVRTQKTVLTMYVTLLDDLVEQRGDRATFREACNLRDDRAAADPARAAVDRETFAFIERVWDTFAEGVADAPRHDEFADVFAYDLRQTANAIEYSGVVNENPHLANLTGSTRFGAHNMVMFAYADVDLMYAPAFELRDFGAVRDLLWDLQELARIGNWLTTWEREVSEGDYTAGIVVLALQEGIVTPADLRTADDHEAVIRTIREHDLEQRFRERWLDRYRSVADRTVTVDSVDLDALVEGMETVFEYHLLSKGLK